MNVKRKKIEVKTEEQILTAMIVSTEFLKGIANTTQESYFLTPYAKIVYRWIDEYWKKYQEAPDQRIQDLYEIHKERLSIEDAELVYQFLETLEDKYEDETFNSQFLIDKAINYFKKRSLSDIAQQVKSLVEMDRVEEAEQEWTSFKKVARQTIPWINPIDMDFALGVYQDDTKNNLAQFPGALGELFGPFQRDTLVLGTGVYGSGKSLFLNEIAILHMTHRYNVAVINLEMSKSQVSKRFYRRIANRNEVESAFLIPVFDCFLNQIDACDLACRSNRVRLRGDEDPKPLYENAPVDYRPCDACRTENHDRYIAETWHIPSQRETMDEFHLGRRLKSFSRSYGDRLRIICYPKFSANLADVNRDLDMLEYSDGFVPDVVVVDYADILQPERSSMNDNEEVRTNETFMALSRLAQERHILVVTVSQVVTENLKERDRHSRMGDAAGSKRGKYGHPDLVFGLMQTSREKASGVMRVNIVKKRDGYFREDQQVILLQVPDLSISCLDSEFKHTKD